MTARRNPANYSTEYIQTYTGIAFWPLEPEWEDIDIADIAHSLALQCRFNGHCRQFYSVAEHSVRVSYVTPPEDALWGLLHDGTEAYLTDLPRPLKRCGKMGEIYREHEAVLMKSICRRFNIPEKEPDSVRHADNVLLLTEQRDLLGPQVFQWIETVERLPERIMPWPADIAEIRFLERFKELTSGRL